MTAELNIHENDIVSADLHSNGSSGNSLAGSLAYVYEKLGDVYDALRHCAPNPRDYCFTSMESANKQHLERMAAVDALRESLECEIGQIYDQMRAN